MRRTHRGLRFDTFNVEIAAMFAPKTDAAGLGHWRLDEKTYPRKSIREIRKIYQLHGKARETSKWCRSTRRNNYNKESREAVYRFFGKQILGPRRMR